MYYLMNKNKIVATFDKRPESKLGTSSLFTITEQLGDLPYGFSTVDAWLYGRKSANHNKHLAEIMKRMNCYDNEGFIRVTHVATINDTFWVKSDKEHLSWEQISLYQNQFTETISKLAFEGVGLYDEVFSSLSPELTCEGSFRKCFRKEAEKGEWGSDIFIYKRGSQGASNAGLEPYCEVLSSEIARIICTKSVSYELTTLHNKLASRCNLFTSEEYGFIPFSKLANTDKKINMDDALSFFVKQNAEQPFREMLVLDALCFNEDRHWGNFGMLFNNDTMDLVCMSPIFDLNLSLLVYANDIELADIGNALYARSLKFGEDFTRVGQKALNDVIRDKVKDMKDFSFSFRGDDIFSPERVKLLEEAVRKQAKAILSNQKLMTNDVFISKKAIAQEELKQKSNEAITLMNEFEERIRKLLNDERYLISVCVATDNVQCLIEDENSDLEIAIDFLNGLLKIKLDGKAVTPQKLKEVAADPSIYWEVKKRLEMYMKEKQDRRFEKFFNECKENQFNITNEDMSVDNKEEEELE